MKSMTAARTKASGDSNGIDIGALCEQTMEGREVGKLGSNFICVTSAMGQLVLRGACNSPQRFFTPAGVSSVGPAAGM